VRLYAIGERASLRSVWRIMAHCMAALHLGYCGNQDGGEKREYKDVAVRTNTSRDPCGGWVEYVHLSPASRRWRRKGNPVSGGLTGPPCFWGI
jgi:hypothetical protein